MNILAFRVLLRRDGGGRGAGRADGAVRRHHCPRRICTPSMAAWCRRSPPASTYEAIAALTDKALADAGLAKKDIDAVAVTYAPGLIGAVLVGVSFAKSAAYALGVPLIPVHHVRGHIAANYLAFPELEPPFVALAISGGNTLIVDVAGLHGYGRSWGPPGTTPPVSASTRRPGCWGCPTPAADLWTSWPQQSAGGVYDPAPAPMWQGQSWT